MLPFETDNFNPSNGFAATSANCFYNPTNCQRGSFGGTALPDLGNNTLSIMLHRDTATHDYSLIVVINSSSGPRTNEGAQFSIFNTAGPATLRDDNNEPGFTEGNGFLQFRYGIRPLGGTDGVVVPIDLSDGECTFVDTGNLNLLGNNDGTPQIVQPSPNTGELSVPISDTGDFEATAVEKNRVVQICRSSCPPDRAILIRSFDDANFLSEDRFDENTGLQGWTVSVRQLGVSGTSLQNIGSTFSNGYFLIDEAKAADAGLNLQATGPGQTIRVCLDPPAGDENLYLSFLKDDSTPCVDPLTDAVARACSVQNDYRGNPGNGGIVRSEGNSRVVKDRCYHVTQDDFVLRSSGIEQANIVFGATRKLDDCVFYFLDETAYSTRDEARSAAFSYSSPDITRTTCGLASIHSAEEQTAAAIALGTPTVGDFYWLGGFIPLGTTPQSLCGKTAPDVPDVQDCVNAGWNWLDGSPWVYQNWLSTEPNNAGGDQRSSAFRHDGFWADVSSDQGGLVNDGAIVKCCRSNEIKKFP